MIVLIKMTWIILNLMMRQANKLPKLFSTLAQAPLLHKIHKFGLGDYPKAL